VSPHYDFGRKRKNSGKYRGPFFTKPLKQFRMSIVKISLEWRYVTWSDDMAGHLHLVKLQHGYVKSHSVLRN
jgi:hypothetical protein